MDILNFIVTHWREILGTLVMVLGLVLIYRTGTPNGSSFTRRRY